MLLLLSACGSEPTMALSRARGRQQSTARWSESGATVVGDAWGDGFGSALSTVSLSSAGPAVLLVGAPGAAEAYVVDTAGTRVLTLSGGAGFGTSVAGLDDIDGDGAAEAAVGEDGAVLIYTVGLTTSTRWTGDGLGAAVANAGDVDGDGLGDLVAGAPDAAGGSGAAWVAAATGSGFDTAGAVELTGEGGAFGHAVAGAGDVNGDGYADVLVGAPELVDGGDLGSAYCFHGGAAGIAPSAATTLRATRSDDRLGWSVATAGDTDADGLDDVIIGLPGHGQANVHLGDPAGLPTSADVSLAGSSSSWFGATVSSAGDVDGDGDDDVVVGAPAYVYESGRIYLYAGGSTGPSSVYADMATTVYSEAWLGGRMDGPGHALTPMDFDEDGLSDIAAGLPGYDEGTGAVELHLGSADADGDGWEAGSGTDADCDDFDADIHPGAAETCNGVDDDCNGLQDDAPGSDTWYHDEDGDSHGDAGTSRLGCDEPEGYVAAGDDCDDGDAEVHPGAEESCDGEDDDCDGVTDEDAVDLRAWFLDTDGDGYGTTRVDACTDPGGYATAEGDCDETDPDVHPGAEEHCDGRDEDCDGSADEDAVDLLATWTDADGDGWGDASLPVYACDGPAGAGDCDDDDDAVHPDADEHCDGVDEDCDGATDEDAIDASASHPDADGDGHGDATTDTLTCGEPVAGDDCDDQDSTVHPAADEHCDGADEDCDGEVDEGAVDASLRYPDEDGDGHGDPERVTSACDGLTVGDDCDDADPDVHPDAEEHCDGVDEDCDALVDEDAVDAIQTYADADGDGYGDSDKPELACDGATAAGDCDDGDATVHPGGDELPDDGVDQDCSGEDASLKDAESADDTCGCRSAPATPWPGLLAFALGAAGTVRAMRPARSRPGVPTR